jgi:hypothetical protein
MHVVCVYMHVCVYIQTHMTEKAHEYGRMYMCNIHRDSKRKRRVRYAEKDCMHTCTHTYVYVQADEDESSSSDSDDDGHAEGRAGAATRTV